MSQIIRDFGTFRWIDLERPSEAQLRAVKADLGLDLHFNLLEDSLEAGHLPKIERVASGAYTFIILRAYSASHHGRANSVDELSNKIAFFVNEFQLLTIHRAHFKFLETLQSDYRDTQALMLAIIDGMLASYEPPLRHQSQVMDDFERAIFLRQGANLSVEDLYYQKIRARLSKKILHLMQGVLGQMSVRPENASGLQDLKDTALNYLLEYDEVIEDANNLLNAYMSMEAQRNNDVMKLLTIFSVFFLPLSFIAGLYGMNFDHMPELRWPYGYGMALGLMGSISAGIYWWFKRRKIL